MQIVSQVSYRNFDEEPVKEQVTGGILFLSLSLQPSLIFSTSERKVLLLYSASPYKVRTQQATLWKNLEMRKKCHIWKESGMVRSYSDLLYKFY